MKEFQDMILDHLDQQIEFLEWQIENEDRGIGYLQDLIEDRMKQQKWLMYRLKELKEKRGGHCVKLVASVSHYQVRKG